MQDVETLIVGAGPAGSSCARELRKAGRDCLVLDRKSLPRVKLCAGWITPKVLSDLQIDPASYPHGMVLLDRMRVVMGARRRVREFRSALWLGAVQYSIRRVQFDAWLLQRSGATTVQHTVRTIRREPDRFVVDDAFCCRYLVGAGGTNCPVKKAFFGADGGQLVLTQEVEFETQPVCPVCTLWFPFAGGYAWYVPKVGAVNIGFGGLKRQLPGWDKAALWREFVGLLRQSGCLEAEPPAPTGYSYYMGQRAKPVKRDRAYIVGDAAGLATLDLAEGIGPAVESGILAARDILGRAEYSTRPVVSHSLPWVLRRLWRVAAWVTRR